MNFSRKLNNLHFVQKLLLQKNSTHFIWNESGYIFPAFSKNRKIFAPTYYGAKTQKFFLKIDEKIKIF